MRNKVKFIPYFLFTLGYLRRKSDWGLVLCLIFYSFTEKESEAEVKPEEESLLNKIITFIKFLYAFVNSCMVTMTRYLNKFSRDYRYVMRTLAIEKKLLKVSTLRISSSLFVTSLNSLLF